ncbi:MAG TPA: hypothetical protein VF142_13545, partial [Longimicrobium sp.]
MAREPAAVPESTPRPDATATAPRPPRRRARRLRRIAAGLAVFVLLLAAGTCALPRAELPAGTFASRGAEAVGVAAARYRAG